MLAKPTKLIAAQWSVANVPNPPPFIVLVRTHVGFISMYETDKPIFFAKTHKITTKISIDLLYPNSSTSDFKRHVRIKS